MKHGTGTILIVEDEEHDIEFLKRAFARAGVPNPVRSVGNGEQAVAYLKGEGKYADRAAYPVPRVILTDLKMPQMTGLEFLRWVHENPRYQVIPTIIFTSSTSQTDVKAAFAYGASGYMVKPLGFENLVRTVGLIAEYWRTSLVPDPEA
jgi:CheY-like chemotaxis protein